MLTAKSKRTCLAKVDCGSDESRVEEARQLFEACARGEAVSAADVRTMIKKFDSKLQYRCCVGNAFYRRYIKLNEQPMQSDNEEQ